MFQRVVWAGKAKERFAEWIRHQITQTSGSRAQLERTWRDQLVQYRAPAKQPLAKFPWEGYPNYVVPSTAGDLDILFANEMTTLHAGEDLWSVSPLNERWVKAAKPLQDLLTWVDRNILHMFDVNARVKLEKYKLGTGIYKTIWLFEERKVRTYDMNGNVVTAIKQVSRPAVDHVKLFDFLIPADAYNIQPDEQGGAPWVAERIRMPVDRARWVANSQEPMFPNYDREAMKQVLTFEEQQQTQHEQKVHDLDYTKSPPRPAKDFDTANFPGADGATSGAPLVRNIELWEVHARFPASSASEDDIVALVHLPTGLVVRAIYAPFLFSGNGVRPYDAEQMFPGDGFYGIGVCEQKEVWQKIQSELFNHMLANTLLANSRMLAVRQGSNILPGEPVYPGKTWVTDGNPNEELQVFQFSDIYTSLPNLLSLTDTLSDRRTGVGDINRGSLEALPSRTPATTMNSLLQEGKKRPDLTIKMARYHGLSNVGMRVVQLLQQFSTAPVEYGGQKWLQLMPAVLGMPEGEELSSQIALPLENAEFGVGVSLQAVSASANKEVEKQGKLELLQLAAQLAPQVVQLVATAQQMQGTPAAQVAVQSAQGIIELFRRVLETNDVRDIEAIVPSSPTEPPAEIPPGMFGDGMGGAQDTGGAPSMGDMGSMSGEAMAA